MKCFQSLHKPFMMRHLRSLVWGFAIPEWLVGRSRAGANMIDKIETLRNVKVAKAFRRTFRQDDRISPFSRRRQRVDAERRKAEFSNCATDLCGDLRARYAHDISARSFSPTALT